MGDPNLEAAAFALNPGEISQIVQVGNLHVFVKCEERLPAMKGIDRKKVEPHLYDALVERKLRDAANEVFQQLAVESPGREHLQRSSEEKTDARHRRDHQRAPDHDSRTGRGMPGARTATTCSKGRSTT